MGIINNPKEYAELMRNNAVQNEMGIVQVSPELWESIASYIEGLEIPFKVGGTVYKICPKCNPNHNGNCKHCCWSGCFMTGCDVGVKVWYDGSHNEYEKQVIPYKVYDNAFMTILNNWNIMFFKDEESANKALLEYQDICNIEDRNKRYEEYKKWESSRKVHYHFMGD